MEFPKCVPVPCTSLPVTVRIWGARSVSGAGHRVRVSLVNDAGDICGEAHGDLAAERLIVMDASALRPGRYQLQMQIVDADGKLGSRLAGTLEAIAGPLMTE
jgi:hypothetical protein